MHHAAALDLKRIGTILPRIALLGFVASVVATTSLAALKPGDSAPGFSAQASLGSSAFNFSLSEALKRGRVVLYFFPQKGVQTRKGEVSSAEMPKLAGELYCSGLEQINQYALHVTSTHAYALIR